MFNETHKRSLTKALTWKILGLVILLVVGSLYLNLSFSRSFAVSLIYHVIMFILYFLHERMWNLIIWGKK